MEKKEISELFDRFTNEPDKEKRHAMIRQSYRGTGKTYPEIYCRFQI